MVGLTAEGFALKPSGITGRIRGAMEAVAALAEEDFEAMMG